MSASCLTAVPVFYIYACLWCLEVAFIQRKPDNRHLLVHVKIRADVLSRVFAKTVLNIPNSIKKQIHDHHPIKK